MEEPNFPPLSADATRVLLENRARFLQFLERRVGSTAAAEELLQDAYATALQRGGQLRDDETAVAWFFRILRNAMVDRQRRHAVRERALERFAHEIDGESAVLEETHDVVCTCVSGVLETLKPEYRDVLRAVDLGDGDLHTFANTTGITANNATVRLHRARQALGRRLRTMCGACSDHGCLDCTCREHPARTPPPR